MGKITSQDLKDLGFTGAMFRKQADIDFTAFLDGVIAEQALVLQGRVGAASYDSTDTPQRDYVKLAEKYLCAAELMSRRITVLCENAVGSAEKPRTDDERRQRDDYREKAEAWISEVIDGSLPDSAGIGIAAVRDSRFEEVEQ